MINKICLIFQYKLARADLLRERGENISTGEFVYNFVESLDDDEQQ